MTTADINAIRRKYPLRVCRTCEGTKLWGPGRQRPDGSWDPSCEACGGTGRFHDVPADIAALIAEVERLQRESGETSGGYSEYIRRSPK